MHVFWSPDLRNNRNSGWGQAIWFSSSQVVLMLTFEKPLIPGFITSSWRSIEPFEQERAGPSPTDLFSRMEQGLQLRATPRCLAAKTQIFQEDLEMGLRANILEVRACISLRSICVLEMARATLTKIRFSVFALCDHGIN